MSPDDVRCCSNVRPLHHLHSSCLCSVFPAAPVFRSLSFVSSVGRRPVTMAHPALPCPLHMSYRLLHYPPPPAHHQISYTTTRQSHHHLHSALLVINIPNNVGPNLVRDFIYVGQSGPDYCRQAGDEVPGDQSTALYFNTSSLLQYVFHCILFYQLIPSEVCLIKCLLTPISILEP